MAGEQETLRAVLLREIVGNPFAKPIRWVKTSGWKRTETVSYVYLDRDILISTVLNLASAAYDERSADGTLDPLRLAVLSDALEEAGCAEEVLLRHLRGWKECPNCFLERRRLEREQRPGDWRVSCQSEFYRRPGCEQGWIVSPGPHVRGCWVLDLLLGKE